MVCAHQRAVLLHAALGERGEAVRTLEGASEVVSRQQSNNKLGQCGEGGAAWARLVLEAAPLRAVVPHDEVHAQELDLVGLLLGRNSLINDTDGVPLGEKRRGGFQVLANNQS